MRYDFADLERLIVDRRLERAGQVAALATRFGVREEVIFRCRRDGLRTDQADRFATKAGFHPRQVWDEWDDDVVEGVCECGDLISFTARSSLCSRCANKERCRNRAKKMRRAA